MFWILALFLVGSGTVMWAAWAAWSPTDPVPDVALMDPISFTARFVLMSRDDVVVTLDCVADGNRGERIGLSDKMPFTIVVELPRSEEWATKVTHEVLEQWTETGEPLEIEIIDRALGTAVRIADASTRVLLGVAG